jgi:hypothetical protein
MPARECPNCFTILPAGKVVAYTDELTCPGCRRPLEVSGFSRNLAAFVGLAAGAVAWRWASVPSLCDSGRAGWLLPMLCGCFAVSVFSPILLMLTADLRLKPMEGTPIPEAESSSDPSPPQREL